MSFFFLKKKNKQLTQQINLKQPPSKCCSLKICLCIGKCLFFFNLKFEIEELINRFLLKYVCTNIYLRQCRSTCVCDKIRMRKIF